MENRNVKGIPVEVLKKALHLELEIIKLQNSLKELSSQSLEIDPNLSLFFMLSAELTMTITENTPALLKITNQAIYTVLDKLDFGKGGRRTILEAMMVCLDGYTIITPTEK